MNQTNHLPVGVLVTFKGVRGIQVPAKVVEYDQGVYLLKVTGRRCARFGYPTGDVFAASATWVRAR